MHTLSMIAWSLALLAPLAAQPYPKAVHPAKVGTYPIRSASGGGYVYDQVLEYRVWYPTPKGDKVKAFATFEEALDCSQKTPGAEAPLVLILQKEWIDEPKPGIKVHQKKPRVTEWKVSWLRGSRRTPEAIKRLLK